MCKKFTIVLAALFFALAFYPCVASGPPLHALPDPGAVSRRMELVREIKAYEARLGWRPTGNFLRYEETLATYDLCTRTGKLDLVLEWTSDNEAGCTAARAEYDTAFFQHEALATINTPLSRSMVDAPLPRFIAVVFHEDFHEQTRGIPGRTLDESGTSLIGLLAAREFAREKYGAESDLFRIFELEVETALRSARVETEHFHRLGSLYERVRRGAVSREEAFLRKAEIFESLRDGCAALTLQTSISCKYIKDNAMFATTIAYSAQYPLFYRLYLECDKDVRNTALFIARLSALALSEKDFVREVESATRSSCASQQ